MGAPHSAVEEHKMTNKEIINALEALCSETEDAEYRTDYSGRGMFGVQCVGVVCYDPVKVIESAVEFGFKGARYDSMGRQWIVYWPQISIKP